MDVQFIEIKGKRYPIFFGMRELNIMEIAIAAGANFNGAASIDNATEAIASATRNGAKKINQPDLGLSSDQLLDLVDDDIETQNKIWDIYEYFRDIGEGKDKGSDKKKAKKQTGTK